jgi:hypothetical protein
LGSPLLYSSSFLSRIVGKPGLLGTSGCNKKNLNPGPISYVGNPQTPASNPYTYIETSTGAQRQKSPQGVYSRGMWGLLRHTCREREKERERVDKAFEDPTLFFLSYLISL